MKNKDISIQIHGVIKPLLSIKIKDIKELEYIEVYENKIKLDTYIDKKFSKVLAKLLYKHSNIKIKIKIKGKKTEKFTIKNNFFQRINTKIYINLILPKREIKKIKMENKTIKKMESKVDFNIVNINTKKENTNNNYKIIYETKEKKLNITAILNSKKIKTDIEKISNNIYQCSFSASKKNKDIIILDLDNTKDSVRVALPKFEKKISRFYHFSKLGIETANLSGLVNRNIQIKGTTTLKNIKYKILSDKKEIPFELVKETNDNSFFIKANISKKSKKIEFIINITNNDILIYETKNSSFIILVKKIKNNKHLNKINKIIKIIIKGTKFLWKEYHFLVPFSLWKKYIKYFISKLKYENTNIYNPFNKKEYNQWLEEQEEQYEIESLSYNPLISIVIPVYNVEPKYLTECLDSILKQTYQNFEVCLADDCSTNQKTIDTLKKYEKIDKRFKVVYREKNGHISEASNSALKIAKGEFVAMMDNDDIIPSNALYEMVKALNNDKTIDFIYTDEDKIDLDGKRCDPNFKSDYAPDSLLSSNYFCHFTLLRRSILEEIGGWRKGFEGAQDYDLFLRFTEKTNHIHHIPKILYHWRKIPGSTSMDIDNKNYAIERGKLALEETLKRRNIKGEVEIHDKIPYYKIRYDFKDNPKVSIIIPTRDYASTLETCLKSIYKKTTYQNFEIIIMNNNSKEKETFKLFKKYQSKYENFKVIDVNTEFNFSNLCNIGVKSTSGEYIVLLNNDTELITKNWLEIMLGYAKQSHIGAVGVKLYYPDNTVQHGGVVAGIGGVAQHAFIYQPKEDYGFYGRLAVPYNYSIVTAACLMVSKSKYNEVNGFEEQLKVAFNDVDFNLKLIEKGYYNIFLPQVELYHFESKSRGLDTTTEKYKRFLFETKFMQEKWNKYIKYDPFYNPNLSKNKAFMIDTTNKE